MKTAKTVSKLIRRVMLLILISALALTGCGQETGWESGYAGEDRQGRTEYIAAKADKSIFDINDVTLSFSFGSMINGSEDDPQLDFYKEHYNDYGNARLYFYNCSNDIHYIKTTEEPLTSYEYDVEMIYESYTDDEGMLNIVVNEFKYNHTESFTIPKEMFTKEQGYVWFSIVCEDALDEEPKFDTFCVFPMIYTKIDENTVELIPKRYWTSQELDELGKDEPLPDRSLWPVE